MGKGSLVYSGYTGYTRGGIVVTVVTLGGYIGSYRASVPSVTCVTLDATITSVTVFYIG